MVPTCEWYVTQPRLSGTECVFWGSAITGPGPRLVILSYKNCLSSGSNMNTRPSSLTGGPKGRQMIRLVDPSK
ncbi:hypothetical protein AB1N83_006079 [Pleurotus pulmonarius]